MKTSNQSIRIIFCLFIFFILSLISVYSSQTITNNAGNIFIKQIIFYIVGVVLLLVSYYYKKEIIKHSLLFYLSFNFLLLILLFLGTSINGSKCWLIIGPFTFQPSEFMKVALIIILSKILIKYKKKNLKDEFKMLLLIFIVVTIPSILTFLEPDTGVVIIYFIITISMILYRGINKKWYFIFLTILIICGIGFFYVYFFNKNLLLNILGNNLFYRIDRLLNWSTGSGYQLENSITVISSSGIFGFGFNNIPLYYPEASTDFIFTTFSSNFGFIGNIIFIIFIAIFDISILSIINKKNDKKDKFIVIGIFTTILYQQIQNISMTIGLLPITGITLPFISYGGSSLLSYMFMWGILLRISHDSDTFLN